jgi:hypothetical protein
MSSRAKEDQIHDLKAKHEAAQKKTFTKWANAYLKEKGIVIEDLYVDLQDGRDLLLLLEKLSGETMVWNFSVISACNNIHVSFFPERFSARMSRRIVCIFLLVVFLAMF